jgi:hypothetical protein
MQKLIFLVKEKNATLYSYKYLNFRKQNISCKATVQLIKIYLVNLQSISIFY